MNEISDERLNEILGESAYKSEVDSADISEYEAVEIIVELLHLRSLNKRLVEDGEGMAQYIEATTQTDREAGVMPAHIKVAERLIAEHADLMKEIGG
jgi:hypothetical protein